MLISYVAALFSLTGIWLNIRKNIFCWFMFMCSDSLWLTYSVLTKQWALSITHIIFMIANIYGFLIWSKKKGCNDGQKLS